MKRFTLLIILFFTVFSYSQRKNNIPSFDKDSLRVLILSDLEEKLSENTILIKDVLQSYFNTNDSIINDLNFKNFSLELINKELDDKLNSLVIKNQIEYNELFNLINQDVLKINTELSEQSDIIKKIIDENFILKDSIISSNEKINLNRSGLEKNNSEIVNVRKEITQSNEYGLLGFSFSLILILIVYLFLSKKWNSETKKLNKKQQEIIEKQIEDSKNLADWLSNDSQNQIANSNQNDHSFAKRVADEIVRMSTNLSRMDESIRGYKQLSASVRKLTQTLSINEYEIVELLNKPYSEGMNIEANFIFDEKIEKGKQIITRIIKPQINYKGKMIQGAQVEVSQND